MHSPNLHFCERGERIRTSAVPSDALGVPESPHSVEVTVVAVVVPPGSVEVPGAVSAVAVVVAVEGREWLVVVVRHGRVAGVTRVGTESQTIPEGYKEP